MYLFKRYPTKIVDLTVSGNVSIGTLHVFVNKILIVYFTENWECPECINPSKLYKKNSVFSGKFGNLQTSDNSSHVICYTPPMCQEYSIEPLYSRATLHTWLAHYIGRIKELSIVNEAFPTEDERLSTFCF